MADTQKNTSTLKDKARELVSIAEGEIQRKEVQLLVLRKENEELRGKLRLALKVQNVPRDCQNCTHRRLSLRFLEQEDSKMGAIK